MTYQQAIAEAKKQLQENNIYDGFAFRYMLELCQLKDIDLYTQKDEEIHPHLLDEYKQGVIRLLNDEPLAYVLGFEWFYGRCFIANNSVLIPREETEELVGNVLADIDEYFPEDLTIFDIATGSGNLGITFDLEFPKAKVYCSDISEPAILVAQENAKNLNSDCTFFVGSMGQPFIDAGLKADVIVCNPPYITTSEEVANSVLSYEPHVALFGGEDGLDFYRQLLDELPNILNDKGMVAFEMGYQQQENLRKEVLSRYPQARVEFEKDLNGLNRMCFVYFNL